MLKASFTLFTSDKDTVAKGYKLSDDKLTKVMADNFYHGHFNKIVLEPENLLSFINLLKPGQFITAGVHQTLKSGRCPNDACRTKEEFIFSDEAGLLIVDCDSLPELSIKTVDESIKALRSLDTALKKVQIVSSPSASSGITFKDIRHGVRGLHLFILVDNAKSIPKALEILHKRSVLAGYVRPQITASGAVLIKSIIDQAMKSPNQPCFEGGARLLDTAIKQRRSIKSHGHGILQISKLKPLSEVEEANYLQRCNAVKNTVICESNAKHQEWREKRLDELVKKGLAPEKAKQLLDKAIDGGGLSGEIEISTDNFGLVTVAEILANPSKYHEQTCADPIEPEYGQSKAKIYSLQDEPCINSLAHGLGTVYRLHETEYTFEELFEMVKTTNDCDELVGRVARFVARSNMLEANRDRLHRVISKKAKVSLASLRADAKAYQLGTTVHDTDHINAAKAVIKHFGTGNLIFVQDFMYIWRGDGVWRICDDREIKKAIHKVAMIPRLSASAINSIMDIIKTELHIQKHNFDLNPKIINCLNGELVFRDGKWLLERHNREHYCTAMIPIAFDSSAKADRFMQFLDEVFSGDADAEDKKAAISQALGYTLITSCHLEKFFMLIGNGANGKSVLLNVLAELIGREYTTAVQPSQFENRFQRGHLLGKLANIITEIAVGAEISDAQLKALVSGEMTTAEHKHKNPFDFVPHAKHWFGTNHLPHTRDFSEALFRRAILIRFNNKFEGKNQDVHLAQALKAELPGILNFALKGLEHLLTNKTFTIPASSTNAIAQWKLEANQVAQFIEDECEWGPGLIISTADLYRSYTHYAEDGGIRHILNRNNFSTRVQQLGGVLSRGSGGTRMISGISLKNRTRKVLVAVPKAQIK